MPYARKYRTTARTRRRKYARRAAASTLQKAWRNRARRKRGNLVVRTVKANRKAIKAIKRDVELKFVNSAVASSRTNYIGNVLSSTKIDNWGFSQSSLDWVAAGGAATQLPSAASYCPVIMQPVIVPQAGQLLPGTTTGAVYSASENTRVGNDITMSHLTCKFTIAGSYCNTNGGNYLNVAQKQTVYAILVLDRDPVRGPPSITTGTPTFTPESIPCQMLPRTPDNLLALPNLDGNSVDTLKSAPLPTANPPGLSTGSQGIKNTDAISFYSKDRVMGKTGRFKVLKKIKLSCYQRTGPSGPNLNGSCVPTDNSLSMTFKAPYKMHFASDAQVTPENQQLLLFLYSNVCTNRSQGGATPSNYVAPPTVTVLSRFSFRDS